MGRKADLFVGLEERVKIDRAFVSRTRARLELSHASASL